MGVRTSSRVNMTGGRSSIPSSTAAAARFDGLELIGNQLFLREGNSTRPLVHKPDDDGSRHYDPELVAEALDLVAAGGMPGLSSRRRQEILDHYGKLTVEPDPERDQEISRVIEGLVAEAEDLGVELGLEMKGIPAERYLLLHRIVVPEDRRRRGNGGGLMRRIIEVAREHDLHIGLNPDDILGTPKKHLGAFYGGVGFKRNRTIGVDTDLYL